MNILDIAIAKKLAGGGGGSGTDNYNDLSNLPKINDTTLSGNKTSANLGLQSEINSDSKLASDLVDDTNQDNKFVTSSEKSTWNGKQNAIDADHKINADYVDDSTSTNKFVTATDKETWNAKQNAIDSSHKLSSDLVDDTNHTNKFVTSTEKQTWNGKQNAIDSDHKLSSSLVSFTTAEAAALASGIDSTKVGQISTNQTNILYAINNGVKNLGNFGSTGYKSDSGITYKYEDNIITITGTKTTADCFQNLTAITLEKNTDYVLSGTRSGSPNISIYLYGVKNGSPVYIGDLGGEGSKTVNSGNNDSWFLRITIGGSVNDSVNSTFTNPMLSLKSVYDQSHDYQPPALPNYDLTYREQQDRNALVECVDNGTKNKLDFSSLEYADGHGAPTVTKTDTTITIASGNAWARAVYSGIHLKAGTYVLSVNITSATFVTGSVGTIRIVDNAWATGGVAYIEFNSIGKVSCIFTVDTEADLYFSFCPNYSGGDLSTANSFTATDVMICTKAAFDVSQKFVPYRPNWDLVSSVAPFYSVPINHSMIYRGQNLGASLTDAQHTALSSGNFTDLYLGDYWTKTVTIPAFYEVTTAEPADWSTNYTSYYTKSGDTYTPVSGDTAPTWEANTYYERLVQEQTNITLKAVIADLDTFYAGYASSYAGINTHHAGVIVTGFNNVVWNKTNSTAGGYVSSLIHKWLVGSVLPQLESWFGSAKVLSHQKLLTNAITGDAASGWAWSSQKISLLSECQLYGMKVWGGSKATNGAYEPGEAFKKLDVFNHIAANLLFGNKNIWCRDIASAVRAAFLGSIGFANSHDASYAWIAPAALILLS